jgi:hypothetical protein
MNKFIVKTHDYLKVYTPYKKVHLKVFNLSQILKVDQF